MQNTHADTQLGNYLLQFSSPSFILSLPSFCITHKRLSSNKKKEKKNQPLLLSLGHGSNTITMVLPGLQGTVQCPIGAPNEHTLHTKIMEKSLALFFYCYQSVVHLQSSPSLTPLSELRVLFSCPFYLYLSTSASVSISPPVLFFPLVVWSLIYGIQGKDGQLYPSKPRPICSGFTFVLSVSLLSLLCKLSTPRIFKKQRSQRKGRAE